MKSFKSRTSKKAPEKPHTWLALGSIRLGFPEITISLPKPFKKGTYVIAEIKQGEEIFKELFCITTIPYKIPFPVKGIPKAIRKATPKEIREFNKKLELEEKGAKYCIQFCKELGINMDLIRVICRFDKSKITFYYTAEGRIDFRQLVKDLAKVLRMRIEMRQVGVRNKAGLIGGIGYCGKEFCCACFLENFKPLSIKMAKEQGLILDPNKISGPCGRLLCCLSYEYENYKEFLKDLPKIGSKISIGEKEFKILKYNFFQKKAYLETSNGETIAIDVKELKNFVTTSHGEELSHQEKSLSYLEEA